LIFNFDFLIFFFFFARHAGKILGTDDPAGSKGLLKWKGVMFAPNDEVDQASGAEHQDARENTTDSIITAEEVEQDNEVNLMHIYRHFHPSF